MRSFVILQHYFIRQTEDFLIPNSSNYYFLGRFFIFGQNFVSLFLGRFWLFFSFLVQTPQNLSWHIQNLYNYSFLGRWLYTTLAPSFSAPQNFSPQMGAFTCFTFISFQPGVLFHQKAVSIVFLTLKIKRNGFYSTFTNPFDFNEIR